MQLLESQIGINPDSDLFPLLDQEWGLAVLHERDNILAEQLNVPLGLLGIFETSSAAQLGENIHSMANNLSSLGLVMLEEKTAASMTYYELFSFLTDAPFLAFGTRDARLLISTNPAHLETILEPAQTLANAATFQTTWKRFSSQMDPILYIDMAQLYSVIPELGGEDLSAIQPIQTLALAGSPLEGNTKQWVLILVVDTSSASK
jgi:hypothetical protein